ncbi:MAG: hypothetical protein WBE62_10800, partial [Methylocella sp.]
PKLSPMRRSVVGRVARAPVFSGAWRRQAPARQKKEPGFGEAIRDACCVAWNALMATPGVLASSGTRVGAPVRIYGGRH